MHFDIIKNKNKKYQLLLKDSQQHIIMVSKKEYKSEIDARDLWLKIVKDYDKKFRIPF